MICLALVLTAFYGGVVKLPLFHGVEVDTRDVPMSFWPVASILCLAFGTLWALERKEEAAGTGRRPDGSAGLRRSAGS